MDGKKVVIKKESKIKRNEEIRTEFLNLGLIRTMKSEIFFESNLTETEVLTNRTSVDSENCFTERINRGSIKSKSCLDSPRMRIVQKIDSVKPTILNDFNQMKDLNAVHGNNLTDNKPPTVIDCTKNVNLHVLNEESNSSESIKGNPSEGDDACENLISDAKLGGCNSSNGLNSNKNEVSKNSISEISPINNQENEKFYGMELAPNVERNAPSQISYEGALNLASPVKVSNINTLPLRAPNMVTSESAVHTQNRIKNVNKIKELKENKFFNGVDIYEQGDNNLISPEDKGKSRRSREQGNKVGVSKGKDNFIKSVNHLVNYFENMESPSPVKTNIKSSALNCEERKLLKKESRLDTSKRQKRKLTDDHSSPNKKAPLHCSLNSSLSAGHYNAEDCTNKMHFVSKNIGLLKKSKGDVQPHSHKADPNFNFNDDTAEFCVVKCRQTQMGSKLMKTPRQPRGNRFTFAQRATNQPNQSLSTPKCQPIRSSELQKHAKEIFCQPNLLRDKLAITKEKNHIDDNLAVDKENDSIDRIELRSFNSKAGYHICMNHFKHLKRHFKEGMSKIEESTYKAKKDKPLEKEESSFVKCFSTMIIFMVVFAFGSYYQYFT